MLHVSYVCFAYSLVLYSILPRRAIMVCVTRMITRDISSEFCSNFMSSRRHLSERSKNSANFLLISPRDSGLVINTREWPGACFDDLGVGQSCQSIIIKLLQRR